MAPSKLRIHPKDAKNAIVVAFNPNTYSITKTVEWKTTAGGASTDSGANAPITSFGGGGSRELTLQLFFDSTEKGPDERDVRLQTDEIVRLTRIERDKGRPPVCDVSWGSEKREDFPFTGTVSSLKQTFVLFDEVGRPLRATLDVTFLEFLNRDDDQRKTDPEATTRVVRRGDSLASIAAEVYGDAGQWRVIANENGIDDPFVVPAGSTLTLPKR
jgi:nucleoid-associated protein YgaU